MRTFGVALLAVVLGMLAVASPASADPVSGGTARLLLGRELNLTLREAGVRLRAEGPARAHGRHLSVRVSGGELSAGLGRLETVGGFELAAGGREVALGSLVLDSRNGVLVGEVGGRRLRLASARRPRVRRDGFGYAVTLGKLVLTGGAARSLNRGLGQRHLFAAGDVLGNLVAGARRSRVTVTYGRAYLFLDEAFAARLRALRVEASPLGSGWLYSPDPAAFVFTDLHGVAALDFTAGLLESPDGLRLAKVGADGSTQEVSLTGLSLDLADGAAAAQLQSAPAVAPTATPVGYADLSVFHKNAFTGVLSTGQDPVVLSAPLAAALDAAFAEPLATPTFVAGERLGTISFSAGTRAGRH